MHKQNYLIRLILLLSIFWLSLTQSLARINLVTGLVVVMLSAYYYSLFSNENKVTDIYRINPLMIIYYFFYVLYSMFRASFVIICRMIQTSPSPGIIVLPTKLNGELAIAILSLSITLTPGTITVDYHEGKLHVLCMYSNQSMEALKQEVFGNYEEILYRIEQKQ